MPPPTNSPPASTALAAAAAALPPGNGRRVMVGMSGGVDSSVAALLLLTAGYQVDGLFMKNWDDDDGTEYCTAATDLLDADGVCARLGIELYTANFAQEYWDNVFAHFLTEYQAGRTPNPDVLCNREIKFKVFADHARTLGAELVATGHYAQVLRDDDGAVALGRGLDQGKDQSYFLHAVSAEQLAPCLFPLGGLDKSVVRQIAADHGLHNHAKKDSTGICFIGERRFKDFLARYLPAQPGPMVSAEGLPLGDHQGLMYYTLGQRQGLGIGGTSTGSEAPWFVVGKDVVSNTLQVAQGDHPRLHSRWLVTPELHWIGTAPALPLRCTAKTRYRQPDQDCTLLRRADGQILVQFDQPQRAVTPGQFVVLYDGPRCLGGGVITGTGPAIGTAATTATAATTTKLASAAT